MRIAIIALTLIMIAPATAQAAEGDITATPSSRPGEENFNRMIREEPKITPGLPVQRAPRITPQTELQTESILFPQIGFGGPGAPMPHTVKIVGPKDELIATATFWGLKFTFRNANGELLGSSVLGRDNSWTYYDPSGNILYVSKVVDGIKRMFDASGKEVPNTNVDHLRGIEQLVQ